MTGRSLLIQSPRPRLAQQALLAVRGVLSVAQVGTALRVLTEEARTDGDPISQRIQAALHAAGVMATVSASEPSLEDVFVAATRRHDAARAAA